ncbi:tyrosine-protein phosphatase [Heliorestis convoluta]|uniref:protein-tyrosine-phosphatase n=1 Tax=Heliorestis convoluta TaxID=356322 RepID=A0A5Q2N1X4_9FIRM|nr:CpsB/CapC family capsule biosynthesis tyrosine phosphatase [Heliorestis convoluta]QGG47292.1 Protein-tyrosine-phosphatase [Heliorestis convoluta]
MTQEQHNLITDIHTHILPGLDDGARTIEEALQMAQQAHSQGITHLIATPHYIEDSVITKPDVIIKACQALQGKLQEQQIPLTIYPGQEIFLSPHSAHQYDQGQLLTLAGTDYILIELPLQTYPHWVADSIYELTLRGLKPILAHPERYRHYSNNLEALQELTAAGLHLQINASSITGHMGPRAQQKAKKMLQAGLITYLGSDAHSPRTRTFHLTEALRTLKAWGINATYLLHNNNRLLHNEKPQQIDKPKRTWWQKLWA